MSARADWGRGFVSACSPDWRRDTQFPARWDIRRAAHDMASWEQVIHRRERDRDTEGETETETEGGTQRDRG